MKGGIDGYPEAGGHSQVTSLHTLRKSRSRSGISCSHFDTKMDLRMLVYKLLTMPSCVVIMTSAHSIRVLVVCKSKHMSREGSRKVNPSSAADSN